MLFPQLRAVAVCLSLTSLIPGIKADVSQNPTLIAQLKSAGTQLDRLAMPPSDAIDWTFDFHAQKSYSFDPASVVNANTASWPIRFKADLTRMAGQTVLGNKLTMAMIQLGPCGMLPPHYHPRASNYVLSISGENHTYAVEENGARVMATVLTPGKLTIFPQGAIHTMMNRACTPAQLVSALSDEDSGTSNLLNNLFRLPEDFVEAAFGNMGLDINGTASHIPPIGNNGAKGSAECLKMCKLSY